MPKTTWGRKETIIWPQRRPIYTYTAIFSAMILTVVFVYRWLRSLMKPLQWFYAPVYVRTSVFGTFSRTHRSEYRMLFLTGHGLKPGPAMNDDVVRGNTPELGPAPSLWLSLRLHSGAVMTFFFVARCGAMWMPGSMSI